MTRQEIAKGIANRFVHSRTYIFLYLGMAALSVTTVILSLTDGCPGPAFYVLEVIINTSMIIEVWIRIIALGNVSVQLYTEILTWRSKLGSNSGGLLLMSSISS